MINMDSDKIIIYILLDFVEEKFFFQSPTEKSHKIFTNSC